jgi:hypothetical protein
MNHSIASSERNSVLSSIPSPAELWSARIAWWRHSQAQHSHSSTQPDTQSSSWWRLCVCLSRFARLPNNPTLYRFWSCELPRRSTSLRPLETGTRARNKNCNGRIIYLCLCTDTCLLLCSYADTVWR